MTRAEAVGSFALAQVFSRGQEKTAQHIAPASDFDRHLVKPVGLQELQPLLAGMKPAEGGDEGH
jgi:hypothetical protein